MTRIGIKDLGAAARRIDGLVRRTPSLRVEPGALVAGRGVTLKLDLLQPTGSFKVRGAASLLTATDPTATDPTGTDPTGTDAAVVAASGGNFGLAVAWAAARLGREAVVFVPATTPADKLAHFAALGANVEVVPGFYAEALAAAEAYREATGARWAHAYDQAEVVAGQGTAALELLADHPELTTLVVACGGGGLLAGTVAAAGGRRVVAVETTGTATLHAARRAGRPVDVEVGGLAASSLGARRIGDHAWAVQDRVERVVLISDDDVREAQRRLWGATRLVAEPGGAAALAAVIRGAVPLGPDDEVGVLVCGANTDPGAILG